jgi:hypothetical protein
VSRLLKTLANIGLVELDEADRGAPEVVPESGAAPLEVAEVPSSPVPEPAAIETAVPGDPEGREGRALADIYAEAKVPPSRYPAEKLLKLLEGLRTLDAHTRKAAVMAMDAADEDWAVDDAVEDARNKIRALQGAGAAWLEVVKRAEAKAKLDVEAQDRYQHEATSSIRKQIADLEALLAREIEKIAKERAGIEAGLQRTREACGRETKRFVEEIARLREIPDGFGPAAPAPRSTQARSTQET